MAIDIGTLTPAAHEQRGKLLENKAALTARISETSRYVSFGLLALYYGLRTAGDAFSRGVVENSSCVITLMAFCAILAVLLDYLQYFFGVLTVNRALNEQDQLYDDAWPIYRIKEFLYHAKQVPALCSAILFLIAIAMNI